MKNISLFLMAAIFFPSLAWAGVMVLPVNEITFNPSGIGHWWNPEYVFEDDSLFALDTVTQFKYDSLGVGFADPGDHPTWVITNVSLSVKHWAHYWKARARIIPYVNGIPMFNEQDTLLVWPPFKFGTTEMTNTVEITQLDTALADSTWNWDDIAGLSVKYEPRAPNTIFYINHLYATVTYIDTAVTDTGHYFEFDPIPDPQFLGIPFPVVIRVRNLLGQLLMDYNDSTELSDLTGTINPTVAWFQSGTCSLMVTISNETSGTAIRVRDGDTSGTSNTFAVVNPGLHHFEFGYIESPKLRNVAFPVSITACDFFGDTIDNFSGQVAIWDLTGTMTPTSSGFFVNGVWSGDVSIDSVISWDVINCSYTSAQGNFTGASNGFEVIPDTSMGVAGDAREMAIKFFNARIGPNPMKKRAIIALQLPHQGRVSMSIFNLLGQQVARKDLGILPSGNQILSWRLGKPLSPGIYFFTVTFDNNNRLVRKVLAVQ